MDETLNTKENKNPHIYSLSVLFPICVALNFALGVFIRDNEAIPLWLDGTGSYFAAAIGGPLYGILVHSVYLVIHTSSDMVNLSYFLSLFPAIAAIIVFSIMSKIGYFKSKRDVLRILISITFIYTLAALPVLIASNGGAPTGNTLADKIFNFMVEWNCPIPISSLVTIFICKFVDNIISIGFTYVLIHGFWSFWDKHFDVKCMEEVKVAVVHKKNLNVN